MEKLKLPYVLSWCCVTWSRLARNVLNCSSDYWLTLFLATITSVADCSTVGWACPVAPTPWGTGARAPRPILQMAGNGGTVSKQETDQTVLTIAKAVTKTTNCAFRAKKVEGRDPPKFFFRLCAGSVFPTYALDRCPDFQIRSGATGHV